MNSLRSTLTLAVAFFALGFPMVMAETLLSQPTQKFVCSTEGCKTVPAKVWAIIDLDKKSYSRCDRSGCDAYPADISTGGIYLNVELPGKSVIAKVEVPTLAYLETVTSGLLTYNSFGKCRQK